MWAGVSSAFSRRCARYERRRPVQLVGLADGIRDLDLAVGADLLEDQRHREQRLEVRGPEGLAGARVERRRERDREVGRDVVPGPRDPVLVEHELGPAGRSVAIGEPPGASGQLGSPSLARRVAHRQTGRAAQTAQRNLDERLVARRAAAQVAPVQNDPVRPERGPPVRRRGSQLVRDDLRGGDRRAVQAGDRQVRAVRAVVARPAQGLQRRVEGVGQRAQLLRPLLDPQPERPRLASLGERAGAGEDDVERRGSPPARRGPPARRRA